MSDEFTVLPWGNEGVQVLKVKHLWSEAANKEILAAVQTKIDEGFANFVADLAEAPYINSVGLNLLIHIMMRTKENGGKLIISNASAKVLQLFEVTKLIPMFELAPSTEEAVAQIVNN